jgi:hypothetical protein
MLLANTDPVIADAGRATHAGLVESFRAALLTHTDEIGHADPHRAVTWSCTVVYGVLARWLGLGSDPASAHEGEWDDILTDLTAMVTAFLRSSVGAPAVTTATSKSRELEA